MASTISAWLWYDLQAAIGAERMLAIRLGAGAHVQDFLAQVGLRAPAYSNS
ncbi:MAG: hypothetical protein R3E68_01515 [Burkholderiaceae bacterium]